MGDEQERVYRNQRLFGGAVGASISHEINNVLAIVGELNGLLEDLSVAGRNRGGVNQEKLDSVTERVGAEIQRGSTLVKLLNDFSHSMDGGPQSLDVAEVLVTVVALSSRQARLRKVGISHSGMGDRMTLVGARFDLQHILFRFLEHALCSCREGSSIGVTLSESDGYVLVEISGEGQSVVVDDVKSKWAALETLCGYFGGRVDFGGVRDASFKTGLHLPRTLKAL